MITCVNENGEIMEAVCDVCHLTMGRSFYQWRTGEGCGDCDLCGKCFFTAVGYRVRGEIIALYTFLRLDEIEVPREYSNPLPEAVVIDMRRDRHYGMRVRDIATKYHISPQRASAITRGLNFRSVGGPLAR